MATSKLDAVVQAKCPKCRRGKIFLGPVYSLKGQKMNDHCPNCGMKYEVEPGYFYAAMYVSYALNVAEIVTTALLTYYLSGGSENPMLYIGTIFTVIFLLAPFNYRYSRVILLHWLSPKVKYNPEYDK
jgi:uncharacterized protein (DUF983 family)